MGRLDDRVACITGAGSGIGRATAELFAAEGAIVVAQDLDPSTAEETVSGLGGGHHVAVGVTFPMRRPWPRPSLRY